MGYGRALLMRDVKAEEETFQKKAKKKSLWGSIGRTVGSLGVMALTGGTVNPLTLGLLTGGASFLGGAIGASTLGGGKLTGGRFFQSSREAAQKELGAFGTKNITESLKSGIKSGIGQKLKLMKDKVPGAKLSDPGFGMDFKGSMIGKAMAKPLPVMERVELSPLAKKMASDPSATLKSATLKEAQKQSNLMEYQTDRFAKDELSRLFDDPAQGSQINVSPSEYQWEGYKPSYEFEYGTPESKGFGGYSPTWKTGLSKSIRRK